MPDRKKLIKSEVIKLFNTTKETLRHYEKVGLIAPEIDDNNYRYYDINELRQLRQIFLFRELGFSIDEMKQMLERSHERKTYLDMLKVHSKSLEEKIHHLQAIQFNVRQLMDLLVTDDFTLSFRRSYLAKRTYYVFSPFDTPFMESLKAYYDTFASFIESEHYSERSMSSIFDYGALADFVKEEAQMGLLVEQELSDEVISKFKIQLLHLPEGEYLSVFYIFREGRFEELSLLKQEIDGYLADNQLEVEMARVIEIEHPELALILKSDEMVYEVQLKVTST